MVASPPGSNPRAGGPPSSRVAQFLNHGRNVWLVRLSPHLPRPGRDDRGVAAPAPLRMRSTPAPYAQCPRLVRTVSRLVRTTAQKSPKPKGLRGSGGSDRRRSGDLSIFSRTLYQLSYRARTGTVTVWSATPTGLEPATSAVTGRRANQLRYGALQQVRPIELLRFHDCGSRTPNGIRTRVAAVKGRCPRPLDDGGRLAAGLAPEDEDYFRQNMPSRSKRPPVTPNTP